MYGDNALHELRVTVIATGIATALKPGSAYFPGKEAYTPKEDDFLFEEEEFEMSVFSRGQANCNAAP